MTDSCILHRVARGDPSGMDAFLERYSGLVWSLARRHSPTPQDAEDAVQEIFRLIKFQIFVMYFSNLSKT